MYVNADRPGSNARSWSGRLSRPSGRHARPSVRQHVQPLLQLMAPAMRAMPAAPAAMSMMETMSVLQGQGLLLLAGRPTHTRPKPQVHMHMRWPLSLTQHHVMVLAAARPGGRAAQRRYKRMMVARMSRPQRQLLRRARTLRI